VKIVIVGCGRVGSVLAESLDHDGHEVVIIDRTTQAFDRLPDDFGGRAIRGDGTDEDTLRRIGAEGADVLLALTEGDNRNVMAAEVALENLGVKKVMAKVNDPVRAAAYAELGLATICRTTLMVDAIQGFLGLGPTGLPSVIDAVAPHAHLAANADGAPAALGSMPPASGPLAASAAPGREG
jgi:trk system potassium uptake protein TrkA